MPVLTYSAATFQVVVSGGTATVQIKPGTTTTRPRVNVALCDQSETPAQLPNPLPENPSYVRYEADVDVTNGVWSHVFSNVASDTYVVVVIPKDPTVKIVVEEDHVKDVVVP